MQVIHLTNLHTLLLGLAAATLGTELSKRVRWLDRLTIPSPVIGGVLFSIAVAALRALANIELTFASELSDVLLLVFFTSVGLSAKLSALKSGGRPLVILCGVTVLLLLAQNLAGTLIAVSAGAHPFYGLLAGSISFVGGPGTAAAWAREAQSMGLARAPEVAVAAATFAVVVGAVAAGPITGFMIRRRGLRGPESAKGVPWLEPRKTAPPAAAAPLELVIRAFLLILIAVAIGGALNSWAAGLGLVLPGFLTAMLAGVAIANTADLFGAQLVFGPIERGGELALHTFLAMYLISLKLWTLGWSLGPLAINVVVQVLVSAAIAWLVLFRLLGSDYDAAVTSGGFLGFGVSSMPVAMATMEQITAKLGPSPRAFLLITLAGSFFVDLANALVVQGLLKLPWYH